MTKFKDIPYMAGAFLVVATSTAQAQSAGTVGDAASGLMDDISNIGKLFVGGGFMLGLLMMAMGLMKMKQAADTNGQQVKYSEGIWRLGVGAGLVAIPALTGMLAETFGFGGVASITEAGGTNF